MCRYFSQNSEILLLALLGLVIAVIEAMHLNLHESLHDVWKVVFPEEMLPTTFENMLKTIISGIVIARGITVHIYLASFLLLFFPVLKERRRILILVWLTVSGFRSILVNGLSTLVGIAICSCLPEAHPTCFEFLTIKGCSVFMWVIVNDFMYTLGRKPHQSVEIIAEKDSEESQSSIAESINAGVVEISEGSSDSLVAKAAVNWFFRLSLGMNNQQIFRCQSRKADRDEELTQKFLRMTPEEVERLTQKIKQILTNNPVKRKKNMHLSPDQTGACPRNIWTANPVSGIKIKTRENVVSGNGNSIFQDNLILRSMSPTTESIIESSSSSSDPAALFRNAATQTDRLPKKILKIIERQEQVMQGNK
ncbi:uncharacterized protein [Halyomorpha halys]|uniref:uncharacterized protein isoform X2 n=1 Tax=Halyomorpha halys TaxID=286706 RepID=UPI0006D52127|nr:uncharacterized protein LOC106679262 isoform X2 [Halyomorpha halys]